MMDEKYELKWKTFPDHIVGAFKDLGTEGHFADVTLVSDDQIQTPAHKVVLSACSPVLKTLLVNNPHSHPLLYLRGIKQTELQALLKFMYFGETQIFENRINEFVEVAKDLEVKEISQEQNDQETVQEMIYSKEDQFLNDTIPLNLNDEEHKIKSEEKVNSERSLAKSRQNSVGFNTGRFSCTDCEATFSDTSHLNRHKKSKHEGELVETGSYSCDECETSFSRQFTLNRHKQSKHAGITYSCDECDFVFNRNESLERHKQSKHAGVRYSCDNCEYQATTKQHLDRHTNSKHI